MKDKNEATVTEHNDLIRAQINLGLSGMKLMELVISRVRDGKVDSHGQAHVTLSKQLISKTFGFSSSSWYSRFRGIAENMTSKAAVKLISDDKRKGRVINAFTEISWDADNDKAEFIFSPSMMPLITEFKRDYTRYALSDVLKLNSTIAVALYRWLNMNFRAGANYMNNGQRDARTIREYLSPSMTVADLRQLTHTEKVYPRGSNFKQFVIEKPLNDINKNTRLFVTFEPIKEGRRINAYQFHIQQKQETTPLRADKASGILSFDFSKASDVNKEKALAEGMKSEYTKLLIKTSMDSLGLSVEDLTNPDLIMGLAQFVYPIYDQLRQVGTMAAVHNHIAYIKRYRTKSSNKHLVRYLRVAAEEWIHSRQLKYLKQQADGDDVDEQTILAAPVTVSSDKAKTMDDEEYQKLLGKVKEQEAQIRKLTDQESAESEQDVN